MLIYNLQKDKNYLIFWIGLVIFFLLNLFSAITVGVHYDEAYYWLFSKKLDLGYFDHPPMIAWMMAVGQLIFKGTLGLRIFTVFFSTASMYFLWILSRKYGNRPFLFWSIIYSVLLIHPYSFISTPDAPLFFFSTAFFLCYRNYLNKANVVNILLLSLTTSLLLYSKYHAVLIIGFTFITNLKLLKQKEFWLYLLLVIILMFPHIYWQFENNFASLKYHLIDSHKTIYKPEVTLNYLLNQLLLTGPWFGWLFLFYLVKSKASNSMAKALKLTGIGTFVFFFMATFSGDFEAHWTLIAFIPLIILSYKNLITATKWHKWLYIGATTNFILLVAIRIAIITPVAEKINAFSSFNGWDADSKLLKTEIGNYPIIFQDAWNKAARFAWYSNDPNISNLNSSFHRHNQFDIWDIDEELKGKTVCVVSLDSSQFKDPQIVKTPKSIWYFKIIPDFHSYYNLKIGINSSEINNSSLTVNAFITNPYNYPINLTETISNFQIFERIDNSWNIVTESDLLNTEIAAKSTTNMCLQFNLESNIPIDKDLYLMLKIGELQPIPSKVKFALE